METVRYESNRVWTSIIFHVKDERYDLTFFKFGLFFNLYQLTEEENYQGCSQINSDLPVILDYLKERLTEEQFKKVEKFCFEHI